MVWSNFLEGDVGAFEYLYVRYARKLFFYGMTLTTDEELVKDSIHDVFVHIHKNRRNLSKTNNPGLYLISSLKNAIYMAFRKQKFAYNLEESLLREKHDDQTAIGNIINREDEGELNRRMNDIWSVLTPGQREIVYYRFVEGLSLTEIAKIKNINYQSVANAIQRSLKKMRDFYSKTE